MSKYLTRYGHTNLGPRAGDNTFSKFYPKGPIPLTLAPPYLQTRSRHRHRSTAVFQHCAWNLAH